MTQNIEITKFKAGIGSIIKSLKEIQSHFEIDTYLNEIQTSYPTQEEASLLDMEFSNFQIFKNNFQAFKSRLEKSLVNEIWHDENSLLKNFLPEMVDYIGSFLPNADFNAARLSSSFFYNTTQNELKQRLEQRKVVWGIAGWNHTFFIRKDGRVLACGPNKFGQLGLGNTDNQYTFG